MDTDVRKDWFMQQHFDSDQLQQIYNWDQDAGRIAESVKTTEGFVLYHIQDAERKIGLCFMKEEYMVRRWADRLGYKMSDGKTSNEFDKENDLEDPPYIATTELWREDLTSLSRRGDEKKLSIISGDYALVAKRTASNAYEILLMDKNEYAKYLEAIHEHTTN